MASPASKHATKNTSRGERSTKRGPKVRSARADAAPGTADASLERVAPDTSVLVDGRINLMVDSGELQGAHVVIAEAVLAELEAMANRGLDAGYNGLDEVVTLRRHAAAGTVQLAFHGRRPEAGEFDQAPDGAVDALIRETALAHDATLITGDKVQAQLAEARGAPYLYLRALKDDDQTESDLTITRYFSPDMMSVHLKQDTVPFGKVGVPGKRELRRIGDRKVTKRELNQVAREIVEFSRRDDRSFVEIERLGATVVQLRDMRIAIARPPFSDAVEITAVRPVTHLELADYELPESVIERLTDYSRGVFVSGPPGSGKSTFAQAVAEYLHDKGTIVKTMESPRDLVLPDEVTQYAPLERDIELTGDFLLLVRPDFVVYDEVRKTRDFEVFADMRLAGVGLIGVTHANRGIDAVQRLIGRVELGMIPQVVDTVVHIIGGKIQQILEMDFTVRVPSGMTEADLARPVIRVRDFASKTELFEIYTYGEQVVVMPIQGEGREASGVEKLAATEVQRSLRKSIRGPFEVEMKGHDRAVVYVQDWAIRDVIGKGGTNVRRLQSKLGLKLDIKTFDEFTRQTRRAQRDRFEAARGGGGFDDDGEDEGESWGEQMYASGTAETLLPFIRTPKKNVILSVDPEYGGSEIEVLISGRAVLQGNLSTKGEMRVSRTSPEGKQLFNAHKHGEPIEIVLVA